MDSISKENKLEIFRTIVSSGFFDNLFAKQKMMDFLKSIWELRLLPSTDTRPQFNKDLEVDIIQHIVNNDDWDLDTLFFDKLSLLDSDEKFNKFVEQTARPDNNENEIKSKKIVNTINEILSKQRLELAIYDYDDKGSPVYKITLLAGTSIGTDFPQNKILFFVDKHPTGYTHHISSHKKPTQYPSFVLVANDWDDFSVESSFDLFYYPNDNVYDTAHIGAVKIICDKEYVDGKFKTKQYISGDFLQLIDFCSLGQAQKYYDNIKRLFPIDYKSIFWALQDCAIFPAIEDKFSKLPQFRDSLIRENQAERLLREERYIIEGQNTKSKYQFSYAFTPKYTTDTISIDFKFENNDDFLSTLPNRVYAIIGKNGVGKTQFITTLPLDIANKEKDKFLPHIPIFSKVIAVSNSYYDNFEIPKSTASFNYIYCGLSKLEKGEKETVSPLGLKQRLQKSCKEIRRQERVPSLKKILENILDSDIIEDLFMIEIDDERERLTFQYDNISSICNKISSGQSTLMYLFCNIVANIRYDSLLLFDEPETHLHPNAITTLMSAIYELLEEYKSYSIITTHSPLIIRELFSKSVYIMERNENYPSIKGIGSESFGENLTVLTEEIFGNKDVPKYYKKLIRNLVSMYGYNYEYEKFLELIQIQNIPLSLNVTLFLKNLIESKK